MTLILQNLKPGLEYDDFRQFTGLVEISVILILSPSLKPFNPFISSYPLSQSNMRANKIAKPTNFCDPYNGNHYLSIYT
jgi:hypothetical protein